MADKTRIVFFYEGAFEDERGVLSVDANGLLSKNQAEDYIEEIITGGEIDHLCNAAIQNFGVKEIIHNPNKGKATFERD